MPFYEPDVVAEAKKLDLLTYLQNYEPQELVHVSGNVYCTKTHDSLRISNGKWCWFSQGIGGKSALDYLIKVNGYSFLEAMERIVGQAAAKPPAPVYSEIKEKPKTLLLPEKYRYAEYAASYLEKRGISWELISFCISTGRLYENNPYHNVVFVGFDKQGKARFACQRGTYDSRFHGDVNGSDKHYSFALPVNPKNNTVDKAPMDELLYSLDRIHIPKSLSIPLMIVYRYAPTIFQELHYINENLKMRRLNLSLSNIRHLIRTLENYLVPLLFRSEKISEELSAASLCKGLSIDRNRTCCTDIRFTKEDYLYLLGMAIVIVALLLLNYLTL